jgi:hypothetical protein
MQLSHSAFGPNGKRRSNSIYVWSLEYALGFRLELADNDDFYFWFGWFR